MENETKILPVVALRGITVLPDMIVHFDVTREKSIQAVEKAMQGEQTVFLVAQQNSEVDEPEIEDLYKIGVTANIKQVIKLPTKTVRVMVEGLSRAEMLSLQTEEGCFMASVMELEEIVPEFEEQETEAMLRNLKELFGVYGKAHPKINKDLVARLTDTTDVKQLTDQIIINIPVYYNDKQRLLEAVDFEERYDVLCGLLLNEVQIFKIRQDLQEKIKEKMDKNQKDYLLREQLKVIREELGDDFQSEAANFEEAVSKLKADKSVKEKIRKEIERFKNAGMNSSESAVIRGYIETLLELPWNKVSKDSKDIKRAEKILDEDHYGMEKVKERILEFLAVRALTEKGESPIICLVGPPGTGKTSIARSVAKSLNKEYVRISLGGVRDEAEIRGHRRTYVGAMPGRIANGLRSAGVKNPLMLLDEIDKVSSDYKGDTSAALLEVLDAEQNVKFRDHYVEIPLDLSEVLFIATANSVQTIPRPLLDRMELIEVSSYTENEKLHIAKEHLLPKQIKKNGLDKRKITVSDKALEQIIRGYTKEAGVRNLERKLGEVCRKAAREYVEKEKKFIKVTATNLEKYLGKERYRYNMANEKDEIGIVRGLAWTSVGGDTLQIEVNTMPGKGEFKLTGQLGDVMKESAAAGISYIRSIADKYQIPAEFFKENDIHIHIPEGAVPKDGPSAGITMATAMISAMTGRAVKAEVAMTGEITLRGRVLPIGGLKEKLLAAKNAGITKVLAPKKNEKDVEEISMEIKKGLEIVLVETMEEVLHHALV
ncbi:MAG: endopeptidase La [Lachnospiraceae bacterium]|nr:endopeptidase La [Lachnospiraceae bacterium]